MFNYPYVFYDYFWRRYFYAYHFPVTDQYRQYGGFGGFPGTGGGGIPGLPGGGGIPGLPGGGGIPGLPSGGGIPGLPGGGGIPGLPGGGGIPGLPGGGGIPGLPGGGGIPGLPGGGTIPGLPGGGTIPGVPGGDVATQDCFETPTGEVFCGGSGGGSSGDGSSNGGGIPGLPGGGGIPGLPGGGGIPGLPGGGGIPGLPGGGGIPGLPGGGGIPGLPGGGGIPGLPGGGGIPGLPGGGIPIPDSGGLSGAQGSVSWPSIPPVTEWQWPSTSGWPTLPSGKYPPETIPDITPSPPPPGSTSQYKKNNIVIGLISGRGESGNSSMLDFKLFLQDYLKDRVNPTHIFYTEWNSGQVSNPFVEPDTNTHLNIVNRISTTPCYQAFIGFSYGGWAVSKLSAALSGRGRKPDFIALIDPVFGPSNNLQNVNRPFGKVKRSYYQKYAIDEIDVCLQTRIPCSNTNNGISCGNNNIPGVEHIHVEHRRDWDGNRVRQHCSIKGRVPIRSTHENLPWNNWVWRQIAEKLVQDIDNIQCPEELIQPPD
ncbi:hypothetical protein JOC83_002267 [Bacillus iocasae]|uniref:Uncharacterized protein n=1 Tax=Priestia iocasae TaxID=2291674 RepID=A0ABS2QVW7_9BACI|nr:hypothetical protein [Metabacillus iocasae]MBM7703418.1 hypothetical protein [Metabacillus iocasae]